MRNYPRICKYWQDLFNTEFVLLDREVNLYSRELLQSRAIGRIDYVTQYKDITYLIEEDMAHADKWHWTKIMAYRAAYLLAHPQLNKEQVKCLVFIRDNDYTADFIHIAQSLGIEYVILTLSDCAVYVSNTSVYSLLKDANQNSAYVAQRDRKSVINSPK